MLHPTNLTAKTAPMGPVELRSTLPLRAFHIIEVDVVKLPLVQIGTGNRHDNYEDIISQHVLSTDTFVSCVEHFS